MAGIANKTTTFRATVVSDISTTYDAIMANQDAAVTPHIFSSTPQV